MYGKSGQNYQLKKLKLPSFGSIVEKIYHFGSTALLLSAATLLAAPVTSTPMWPQQQQQQQPSNGFAAFPPQQQNNSFVSEANFSNVFDNTDSAGELPLVVIVLGLPCYLAVPNSHYFINTNIYVVYTLLFKSIMARQPKPCFK